MGLKEFKEWQEGYKDGVNTIGSFLTSTLKHIEDKKLRKMLEMLSKDWENYGKKP